MVYNNNLNANNNSNNNNANSNGNDKEKTDRKYEIVDEVDRDPCARRVWSERNDLSKSG